MTDTPFDVGLQLERTLLAWRRTCLALAVGAVLVARFGFAELGSSALVLSGVALALAGGAYVDAARRYRRAHGRLTGRGALPSASVPVTLAAASVVVFAVACGAWLVASAL